MNDSERLRVEGSGAKPADKSGHVDSAVDEITAVRKRVVEEKVASARAFADNPDGRECLVLNLIPWELSALEGKYGSEVAGSIHADAITAVYDDLGAEMPEFGNGESPERLYSLPMDELGVRWGDIDSERGSVVAKALFVATERTNKRGIVIRRTDLHSARAKHAMRRDGTLDRPYGDTSETRATLLDRLPSAASVHELVRKKPVSPFPK